MAMQLTPSGLIGSFVELIARFAEVATTDPVVAAMLASGAVLTTMAVSVFGYLAAGAALDFLAGAIPSARQPPSERR